MINEYSRMFLLDAVCKYRNAEHEMLDIYCERTRHAHDDAADYLCAAVEVFLKNDDEDFRDILNRACWNGEKKPTDEILMERLKRRAKRIVKKHRPEFVTAETLAKRLKPVIKKWRSKPMSNEEIAKFEKFMEEIEVLTHNNMTPLKIEYTIYNRPVIYEGEVFPSVGIIDVSDKFSFEDNEEVCSSIFGKDEDDVIAQAEEELRDMLPERYKDVAIELEPKLTEKLNDYKPIPYETFFKDPVHYYLTDCGDEPAGK